MPRRYEDDPSGLEKLSYNAQNSTLWEFGGIIKSRTMHGHGDVYGHLDTPCTANPWLVRRMLYMGMMKGLAFMFCVALIH